jgi:hypothetical protein
MRFRLTHYLFLTIILFAFSCTVQKRVYRKGYFVQSSSQKSSVAETPANYHLKTIRSKTPVSSGETKNKRPSSPVTDDVLASVSNIPSTGRNYLDAEPCDSLFLKDGSVLEVVVKEINPKDIRYKLCDFQDGPDYLVEKFRIEAIHYKNGKIELFNEPTPPPLPKNKPYEASKPKGNEKSTNAALSLSFGILGIYPLIFLGSLIGIVFGVLALNDFKKFPGRYSNEISAKAGIGLSLAGLVFWFAIILLFLI